MIHRPAFCFAAFAILAGCTARPLPSLTSAHPASPGAAEAPALLAPTTLTAAGDLPVGDTGADHGGKATGHGAHRMSATNAPAAAESYTCPMHPEVRATNPGRCPKCGMTLRPQAEDHSATGRGDAH